MNPKKTPVPSPTPKTKGGTPLVAMEKLLETFEEWAKLGAPIPYKGQTPPEGYKAVGSGDINLSDQVSGFEEFKGSVGPWTSLGDPEPDVVYENLDPGAAPEGGWDKALENVKALATKPPLSQKPLTLSQKPLKFVDYPASSAYGAGIQSHQIAHKVAEKWQVPQGTKGFAGVKPEPTPVVVIPDGHYGHEPDKKVKYDIEEKWVGHVHTKCCCPDWPFEEPNKFCPIHGIKTTLKGKLKASLDVEKTIVLHWYNELTKHGYPAAAEFRIYHDVSTESVERLFEIAVVSAFEDGVGVRGEHNLPQLMKEHVRVLFPKIDDVQLIAAFDNTQIVPTQVTQSAIEYQVKGIVVVHAEFPPILYQSLLHAAH
jgi:hypothetical protein